MLAPFLAVEPAPPVMRPYHHHWRQAALVVASAWKARGRTRTLLRAAAGHALSFQAWQSLVRVQGLTDRQAVELMQHFVCTRVAV
jgi:hypothetical protein